MTGIVLTLLSTGAAIKFIQDKKFDHWHGPYMPDYANNRIVADGGDSITAIRDIFTYEITLTHDCYHADFSPLHNHPCKANNFGLE